MGTNLTRSVGKLSVVLLLAALMGPGIALAQHEKHSDHPSPAAAADKTAPAKEWQGDPYLLETDPVSGQKLGDKPIIYQHEGRELRFAGPETLAKFKADPAKYLAQVDQQMIQQQLPFYPLETCPVSGEKLGGMSKPVDLIYKNRLVRLCCKSCIGKFQKTPAKFIAQLDQAVIAKQKGKAAICPVSKEKLGEEGKPVSLVAGNRLVELCCEDCVADFNKNPLKYLAPAANASKGESAAGGETCHDESEKCDKCAPRH